MFIAVVVVVILGSVAIGGPEVIWNLNDLGGRLIITKYAPFGVILPIQQHNNIFFSFTTSMYERHTVLSVVIGGFFYWTSFNAVNQMMVQRYLALPNKKQSQM